MAWIETRESLKSAINRHSVFQMGGSCGQTGMLGPFCKPADNLRPLVLGSATVAFGGWLTLKELRWGTHRVKKMVQDG